MNEKQKNDMDLFLPGGYVAPESKESVVDSAKGTVTDIKELPPLEQMKLAARRFNIPINDKPKKNCKKCYERGYIGLNKDKSPVPCNCMFPPKEEDPKTKGQIPLSFLPKKAQRKFFREKKKQLKKELRKESTLRELRKIKDEMLQNLVTSGGDQSPEVLPADPTAIIEPIKESEETNGEVTQG